MEFPDYSSLRLYQTVCKHMASKPTHTMAGHTHRKHQNSFECIEDAIDREFEDLFEQWRKLTSEILSEPTERYEMGESVLLGKAIPYPAQVNSVE